MHGTVPFRGCGRKQTGRNKVLSRIRSTSSAAFALAADVVYRCDADQCRSGFMGEPQSVENFENTEPMPALDGCNRLQFGPSISLTPDSQAGSTPTGLTVGVHVPQAVSLDAEGLAEADVKNTTVALPAGVAINPAGGDGLEACSEEQIAPEKR